MSIRLFFTHVYTFRPKKHVLAIISDGGKHRSSRHYFFNILRYSRHYFFKFCKANAATAASTANPANPRLTCDDVGEGDAEEGLSVLAWSNLVGFWVWEFVVSA